MRYDEAMAELFSAGAEMVVIFPTPDDDGLLVRGIVLNGLRKVAGTNDLEEAAAEVGAYRTNHYLVCSAIDGIQDGPTGRKGR